MFEKKWKREYEISREDSVVLLRKKHPRPAVIYVINARSLLSRGLFEAYQPFDVFVITL